MNKMACRIPVRARLLALWTVCCCLTAPALGADKPLTAVADLRYGVSLYHYFQNENLQALSELLVAQKKGGIRGHGDNPEIMEGGFSMAYGMERKAADIFTRLLDSNRPQQTRDAAWFYLAQMRYLRGDWAAAEQALSNISERPVTELAGQLAMLRFNLAVRQNQLEVAQTWLKAVKRENPNWPYMHFNMGSAYSRNGRYAEGVEEFTTLLKLPQRSPEYLALYDKSMTAAGYSQLLQQHYPQAIEHFMRVRLDSPLSNRALLGYGWAAVEMEDYALALKPWQALSKRSLIDENTQEALVAIPYAYEKMGYQQAALTEFKHAEGNYLAEIKKLDQVIDNVQGYAIREALNIERSEDFDWLHYAQKSQLSPQLSYLVPLFSQESFIGLVQELRDLLAIQEQFQQWQIKLTFYREMLNERESNRAQELDFLAQQELGKKIAAMEARRNKLAETLAQIHRERDVAALVSLEEAPKMQRIVRSEKNVRLLQQAALDASMAVMPAEELALLAESLRRQKGLLLWQTADHFDERYWRVKRGLAQVNEALNAMRSTQSRISNVVDKGFDLAPYRRSIAAAEEQLLTQTVDIEIAVERGQDALRGQVLSVLRQQRERLFHYLAQSRLSIARLMDQAAAEPIDKKSQSQDPVEDAGEMTQ